MTNEDTIRAVAIEMLASGLVTIAEVAELTGRSRQLIRYWATQSGIDVPRVRRAWLQQAWRQCYESVGRRR